MAVGFERDDEAPGGSSGDFEILRVGTGRHPKAPECVLRALPVRPADLPCGRHRGPRQVRFQPLATGN